MKIIKNACEYPLADDGLIFDVYSLQAENIIEDADYQGVRITFLARLGRSLINLRLDIGFTDEIVPRPQSISYPVLLSGMERREPWQRFLVRNRIDSDKIIDFANVIERLRYFLLPIHKSINEGLVFSKCWKAGQDWE